MTRFYNIIFLLLIVLSFCRIIPSSAQPGRRIITYQSHSLNIDSKQEDTEAFDKWIDLDNIAFFTSDDNDTLALQEPYSLYGNEPGGAPEFYITFNLQQKQKVAYELMDTAGRLVACNQFDEVIDQTLEISPGDVAGGLYIVRLRFGGKSYSKRVYIGGQ